MKDGKNFSAIIFLTVAVFVFLFLAFNVFPSFAKASESRFADAKTFSFAEIFSAMKAGLADKPADELGSCSNNEAGISFSSFLNPL